MGMFEFMNQNPFLTMGLAFVIGQTIISTTAIIFGKTSKKEGKE